MSQDDKSKNRTLFRPSPNQGSSGTTVVGPPINNATSCEEANPVINVHEVDGTVEAIEVQCSCGERILIRCNYE